MIQRVLALEDLGGYDLSSLQVVMWAGSLPNWIIGRLREIAGDLRGSYGMTEMGGITLTDHNTGDETLRLTVGRVLDDVEIRFEALEGSEDETEILLRCPTMIREYWGKPAESVAAFDSDGWFHTGDLGTLRDGNLVLAGRSKLLIRSGGYNLSPIEIEAAIETHAGVVMAAVVPVPDEEYGEAAHAVWVGSDEIDTDDIAAHLRAHLSNFKVPKRFWQREALPLLANGKVNRRLVREQLLEEIAVGRVAKSEAGTGADPR
jgi:acyl-CoA synthetase (AMP-forming)/AMP-acid ligase II